MKAFIISPLFTTDCFKVLVLFSLSPGSRWRRKDLKEKTRLHNVPLDRALCALLQTKALIKENNHYALNLDNESAKVLIDLCRKQYRAWRELPLDVFYLLTDLAETLTLLKDIEAYLFGSYAKLVYREDSDVDLAILYSRELDKQSLAALAATLTKIYRKKIELHYFERSTFYQNKKDPLVKGILKDGVKLW